MESVRKERIWGLMRRRTELRLLSALVVAGAGCASDAERSEPSDVRLQVAAEGLCDAEVLALDGQIEAARTRFFDRSHSYLHELAALATERDPGAAASLLEAKQRLEETLKGTLGGGDVSPAEVARQIAAVLDGLRRAAVAVGLPQHACLTDAAG